jgi:dihydroorotase
MNTLISQAHVIDPTSGFDGVADVAISDGKLLAIGKAPAGFVADLSINAKGLHMLPGLVDLRARMRDPGYEHAGMLASETQAAAAGGVTTLLCPPDTDPVLDEPGLIEMLRQRAAKLHGVRVLPLGALTLGLKGEQLTEMAELVQAGCVGLGQASVPLPSHTVLLRALQYAATFDLPVFLQPLDLALSKGGVAASGPLAMRLGLPSVSVAAESIALYALFELMRSSGARVHVCGLSSARGVELLRAAKAEGLPVTADVSIHNLHLTDADIGHFDSRMRLQPVVRQQRDRDALRAALADGTIDALVSDHTPVLADEKHVPFSEATPGASAIELLLSLCLKWAQSDGVPMSKALSRVTCGAASVLGALSPKGAGQLAIGARADLCLVDLQSTWQADASSLLSQSKFTPFAADLTGTALPGRVIGTWVAGQRVFQRT